MLNKAKYGSVTALEISSTRRTRGSRSGWTTSAPSGPRAGPEGLAEVPKVLGTPWVVSGVQELGKRLKEKWTAPAEKTLEQVESEFRVQAEELQKSHPGAVAAVFRNGEPGPDGKVYDGWKDAHLESHGPDTNMFWRAKNTEGTARARPSCATGACS